MELENLNSMVVDEDELMAPVEEMEAIREDEVLSKEILDEDDMENELVEAAMSVIVAAGEARDYCTKAMEKARAGQFDDSEEFMQLASKMIAQAHCGQTDVIQDEARGVKHDISLLFIHAQDTLMTIMSEINMTRQMIEICKMLYAFKESQS